MGTKCLDHGFRALNVAGWLHQMSQLKGLQFRKACFREFHFPVTVNAFSWLTLPFKESSANEILSLLGKKLKKLS